MFLIIQTGDPVAAAIHQFGKFYPWFVQGLGLADTQASCVDVHLGQSLPDIEKSAEQLTGIVITGSPAMVTERDEWLKKTQHWLDQIMAYKIPTLGVCFGHQLLADLLGGQVGYNSKGRNLGHSDMVFTNQAKTDDLLKNVSQQPTMPTFASHLQHVKVLPRTATLLGSCEFDENHAFRAEEVLWGLQFHPEWKQAITETYIDARHDSLIKEGFDPAQMKAQLQPCKQAYGLLARFVEVAKQNSHF